MLKQRVLTASLLAPMMLAVVVYASRTWFLVIVGVLMASAVCEWSRLCGLTDNIKRAAYIGAWLLCALLLLNYFSDQIFLYTVAAVWWLLIAIRLIILPQKTNAWPKLEMFAAGVFFLAITFAGLDWLRLQHNGRWLILGLLAIVWVADISAFFAGKRFGRRKLAAVISPGKTIEGALAAILVVSLIASLVSASQGVELPYIALSALFCALMVMMSIAGDLYESKLKRLQGLKDSGTILPGHGGILDRIDSMIAVLPLFVLIIMLFLSRS